MRSSIKKFKIVTVLVVLTILSVLLMSCNSNDLNTGADTATNDRLQIVTIGDSIAEAILGPSPLSERESFGYWAILGKINDYQCYNRSVSGHRTSQLLGLINADKDEDATMMISRLKTADVIQVSILGNDFLQDDIMQIVFDALYDNFEYANSIAEKSSENFAAIIQRLKELNPNALIIVQTIYNPVRLDNRYVSQADIDKYNITEAMAKEAGDKVLNIINSIIKEYLKENPNAFQIADVYTAFQDIYNQDKERGIDLIYPDSVHPSNEGHAVIACCTQRVLEKNNLADEATALKNYKKMQIELAKKIYPSVCNDEFKNSINGATDIEEVVEIFFRMTKGQVPTY